MNAELLLLADARHADLSARRAPHPRTTTERRAYRPTSVPLTTAKDHDPMNTWHIDTDIQLALVEMKRNDQLRDAMMRQHLRAIRPATSPLTTLRLMVANTLITLGQTLKPEPECEPAAPTRIAA
ncbi:MAG: hypothetical protein ACTHQE_09320 [Thermomicrobiales bacterium]